MRLCDCVRQGAGEGESCVQHSDVLAGTLTRGSSESSSAGRRNLRSSSRK